jgi:hypothetical protein
MKTIWKFPLDADATSLPLKEGAEILTVGVQGNNVCVWVLLDSEALDQTYRIATYGTGFPMSEKPGRYVGTFFIADAQLVFHVFDMGPV